ncbi:MAG: hypothetical protein GXX90_10360, partial [Microbacteriaceae bacterium]|nr:hypothetical protein [Microbacteriaceae bacterium]
RGAAAEAAPASPAPERFAAEPLRAGLVELRAGASRVRVAPDAGIAEWSVDEAPVLRGPYPSAAPFASLAARRTGLWCTRLADRDHPDQGVEWADDRDALEYADAATGAGIAPGGWTLAPGDDDGLVVRADAGEGPRDGAAPAAPVETAIHFVPDAGTAAEIVVEVLGRRWRLDPGGAWRGAVDAAAVVLRDGRALVAEPVGERAELFVRSTAAGPLVTALGRGPLELRLRVVASRALAERALAGRRARAGEGER